MPNTILKFWSQFDPYQAGLHLHPKDREWFEEHKWDVQNQASENFDSYVKGNRYGRPDKQLHLSLLPVPFHGDIRNAQIFILLMNPGLSTSDYYAEEDPQFRSATIENLFQRNVDDNFPFFGLNPKFAWSGGFVWWEARLRPILQHLRERRGGTYYDALRFLSRQIAVIELAPYHSIDGQAFSGAGNPWANLPSAKVARDFVNRLRQSPKKSLIVVSRSHEKWDIPEKRAANIVLCPRTRGVTFNPQLPDEKSSEAGRRMLEQLGYPI